MSRVDQLASSLNPNGAGRSEILPGFPTFARELAGTLAVHSQFVLHGNIRDLYLVDAQTAGPDQPTVRPLGMMPLLWHALSPSGYRAFVCYDPVDVLTVFPADRPEARQAAEALLGLRGLGRKPSLGRLRSHLARVVGNPEPPPLDGESAQPAEGEGGEAVDRSGPRAAFVIDYAARITRVPGTLEPLERDFFLYCQKLALTATPRGGGPPDRPAALFNPVIWLVEGERDLPAWLTAGVGRIRTIAIPMPNLDDRTKAARLFGPEIAGRSLGPDDESYVETFANGTDGLTVQAMLEITRLARDRRIGLPDIADAVRVYKLGVEDNPWRRSSVRQQIARGETSVREVVLGQPQAIGKTLDILKRATLGLSGAQASSSASRPRGVLFFAGPTGVGKTELAKQVAGMLFGDPHAYLRFDMSEFSADHSADRLTGAPPGYVGFEAGGELTGAVRRQPFQVVLFDEIEKAHPQVLDKFLQILEDGRLTDGQGVTTHFSECVLIFTSNLGIIRTEPTGEKRQTVFPGTPYAQLESEVKAAIREHFTTKIARPELLNRLGDNIVVFDFIGPETAAYIFSLQLRTVRQRVLREQQIPLSLDPAAEADLRAVCTAELGDGGRGIGNKLESHLINPLARYLFDHDVAAGTPVHITAVHPGTGSVGSTLSVAPGYLPIR